MALFFFWAIIAHDITPINNKTFEERLKKSKDTVFVLTFFSSWITGPQNLSAIAATHFESVGRPVQFMFVSLDTKEKIYYSIIPYLITQGISKDGYFIDDERPTDHGFSVINSKNSPGVCMFFRVKSGVVTSHPISNENQMQKYTDLMNISTTKDSNWDFKERSVHPRIEIG